MAFAQLSAVPQMRIGRNEGMGRREAGESPSSGPLHGHLHAAQPAEQAMPLSGQELSEAFLRLFRPSHKRRIEATRHIGGECGFVGTLQAWTQDLQLHPRIHYIVPAIGREGKAQTIEKKRPAHQDSAMGTDYPQDMATQANGRRMTNPTEEKRTETDLRVPKSKIRAIYPELSISQGSESLVSPSDRRYACRPHREGPDPNAKNASREGNVQNRKRI